MNNFVKTAFFTLILFAGYSAAQSSEYVPEQGTMIKQATKQCEGDVGQHCVAVLCPAYCAKMYERRKNKEELIQQCLAECTLEKRCKLKPLAGMDEAGNKELDAQGREELMQCIAQVRDPEGTKSGRRMIDWKEVQTPSWEKLMK